MKEKYSEFGIRLNQIMDQFELKQYQFADIIGVSPGAVSQFLAGKRNPTNSTKLLIEIKFRINRHWLLTGEGEMLSEDKQGNKDSLRSEKEVEILKDKLIEALTENSALKERIIEFEKKNS